MSNRSSRNPEQSGDGVEERLREHTSDMLRYALDAQLVGRFPNASVRRSLRGVCSEAQRSGMRAEQLLVILKDSWRRLPETRRIERSERDEALGQVITLCIREYYAADGVGEKDAREEAFPILNSARMTERQAQK
jgi:hypothetical protein